MSKLEFGNKTVKRIGTDLVNVKLTDLKICSIQRKLDKKHVNKIVNNFDERKFGVISVINFVDSDEYEIIDGMHRIEALKIIAKSEGYNPSRITVACQVYDCESKFQAFKLLKEINKGHKRLSDTDLFRAQMCLVNSDAYELNEMLKKVHVSVKSLDLIYGDVNIGGFTRVLDWFEHDKKLGVKTMEDGLRLLKIVVSQRRRKNITVYDIETVEAYARAGYDISSSRVLRAVKDAGDKLFIKDQSKDKRLSHFKRVLDSYMAFYW